MEQGDHIAIANIVALTGFAAKNNALMQITSPSKDGGDFVMTGIAFEEPMTIFKLAFQVGLNNATLEIVLELSTSSNQTLSRNIIRSTDIYALPAPMWRRMS